MWNTNNTIIFFMLSENSTLLRPAYKIVMGNWTFVVGIHLSISNTPFWRHQLLRTLQQTKTDDTQIAIYCGPRRMYSQVIQNRYNPSMVIVKLSAISAHKDHVSIIILLFYCTPKNSTAKRHTLYDKCPSVHRTNSPCTLVPHITVVAATATNRGNGIWDTKRIALDLPIYMSAAEV